jgi:hypothetical protein
MSLWTAHRYATVTPLYTSVAGGADVARIARMPRTSGRIRTPVSRCCTGRRHICQASRSRGGTQTDPDALAEMSCRPRVAAEAVSRCSGLSCPNGPAPTCEGATASVTESAAHRFPLQSNRARRSLRDSHSGREQDSTAPAIVGMPPTPRRRGTGSRSEPSARKPRVGWPPCPPSGPSPSTLG